MNSDELDEAINSLVDSNFNKVLEDIFDERIYQIGKKGYSPEHDDKHNQFELVDYARTYLTKYTKSQVAAPQSSPPTDEMYLIKAIALLVAEAERIERLNTKQKEEN